MFTMHELTRWSLLAIASAVLVSVGVTGLHTSNAVDDALSAVESAGATIIVTRDGRMPPVAFDGEVILFRYDEWVGVVEHETDPLDGIRPDSDQLKPAPASPDVGIQEHTLGPKGKLIVDPNTGVWYYEVWAYILPAEGIHQPLNACNLAQTTKALNRFTTFTARVEPACIISATCSWDAPAESIASDDLWKELRKDVDGRPGCASLRDSRTTDRNEIVLGWVGLATDNGISNQDQWYALQAEACDDLPQYCNDWPEAQIVQHEVSHLFSAADFGTWPFEGHGIMNYWDANNGATHWDAENYDIVEDNIQGCHC